MIELVDEDRRNNNNMVALLITNSMLISWGRGQRTVSSLHNGC